MRFLILAIFSTVLALAVCFSTTPSMESTPETLRCQKRKLQMKMEQLQEENLVNSDASASPLTVKAPPKPMTSRTLGESSETS